MSTARASRLATRLTGVRYDEYLRFRAHPGNRGLRMAYHDGVLEIMSPEFRHEKAGRRLGLLIVAYAEQFDVACETAGATTFYKGEPDRKKGKGKEPDESFYLGDVVALVNDRDTIDLASDPPPSLWIEVDNRASSKAKLPLYAALGDNGFDVALLASARVGIAVRPKPRLRERAAEVPGLVELAREG